MEDEKNLATELTCENTKLVQKLRSFRDIMVEAENSYELNIEQKLTINGVRKEFEKLFMQEILGETYSTGKL